MSLGIIQKPGFDNKTGHVRNDKKPSCRYTCCKDRHRDAKQVVKTLNICKMNPFNLVLILASIDCWGLHSFIPAQIWCPGIIDRPIEALSSLSASSVVRRSYTTGLMAVGRISVVWWQQNSFRRCGGLSFPWRHTISTWDARAMVPGSSTDINAQAI